MRKRGGKGGTLKEKGERRGRREKWGRQKEEKHPAVPFFPTNDSYSFYQPLYQSSSKLMHKVFNGKMFCLLFFFNILYEFNCKIQLSYVNRLVQTRLDYSIML